MKLANPRLYAAALIDKLALLFTNSHCQEANVMRANEFSLVRRPTRHSRRGSMLVVVLVVIALLTLGAYTFSETMISESQATGAFGREVQARASADSGIELAVAVLGTPPVDAVYENVHHDPQHFGGITIREAETPRGRARFTLAVPNESDATGSSIRMGLIDESSKLNLNTLVSAAKSQSGTSGNGSSAGGSASTGGSASSGASGTGGAGSGSTGSTGSSSSNSVTSSTSSSTTSSTNTPEGRLLMIPGMTDELADAILDFIDSDETAREFGCESEYYESLSPPYPAKNSPLESLDELLLVRGVTPSLLYGEDMNRNGLLDPNENDGDASFPPDNADGALQMGWSAYLTVFGREKNTQSDGTQRININSNDLATLYDTLEESFDSTVAQFVVAYRMIPAATTGSGQGQSSGAFGGGSSGSGSTPAGVSSGNNGARSGSSGASTGGSQGVGTGSTLNTGSANAGGTSTTIGVGSGSNPTQQIQQAAKALGAAIGGGGSGTVTRGGMDLSQGAKRQVSSIYELIGASVTINVLQSQQSLQSPWSSSGSDMASYLPLLLDTLTTNTNTMIDGRININQARYETLLTIPGVTESLASSIMAARQGVGGDAYVDTTGARATAGWLVIENLVDLPTMQQIDRYVTARGGIYRVQSIGYFDEAGPFTRLEAVIDTTQSKKPPLVISLTDLTELGRGYPTSLLMGGQ